MFSKLTRSIVAKTSAASVRRFMLTGLIGCALSVSSGCSFRKNAPSSQDFNVGAGQLGCLDRAGEEIRGFVQGTASPQDVGNVYDCASHVLDDFINDTEGAQAGSYSSDELRRFLATYFVHQIKLTDDLMRQIGFLKQGLVGGDADRITDDEIHRLQNFFAVMKEQSQNLLPFMPLETTSDGRWSGFAGKTWSEITPEEMNRFARTLVEAATAIGSALDGPGMPYRFDQMADLITAFEASMPETSEWQSARNGLQSVFKNLDLISRAKQTLINPEVGTLAQRLDPRGAVMAQPGLQAAFLRAASELDRTLDPSQPYQVEDLKSVSADIHTVLDSLPGSPEFEYTRDFLNKVITPLDTLIGLGTPLNVQERMTLLQLLLPQAVQLSSGNDWAALLSTAARWGNAVVRLEWYLDSDRATGSRMKRLQGQDLQQFRAIFDHVYGIVADVVARHNDHLIDFDEMGRLVSALPADHLMASPASIKSALQPLIKRIIGGLDLSATGREAPGLIPENVQKLHDIFYNWYEGQHFLETLYSRLEEQDGDGPDKSYVRDTLLKSPTAERLWDEVYEQSPQSQWSSTSVLAARRIENLLRALRPLFQGDENEISFPRYQQGLRYSFHDLSELNWMQSLSRLLLRGYSTKDGSERTTGAPVRGEVDLVGYLADPRVGMGINLTEFNQFFSDFMELGVSLKFFDPNDKNSAANRFREGDTFTYVSDGNGYLDLNETTTLLAFAVSTMRKAMRIHHDIAKKCPLLVDANHKPILDQYGELQIDDGCYAQLFFGNVDEYWNGMDEMSSYYRGLSEKHQELFQQLLEISGRKKGYQPGVAINSDDSEGLVAALQYIEAIFSNYDVDDSGYLNSKEADRAFPVFERVLQQVAQSTLGQTLTNEQAKLVFTYLLAKGKVPNGAWGVFWWGFERWVPGLGDFKADRMRALQIFAAIAEANNPSLAPTDRFNAR